ncbi:hypothetical protein RJ641_002842 [Dillenia turbinata]|uniref:Uncharacterized protein n=1 Tax=Dillenia turbinata TaxID=194707 RepID=A0AAN8Z8X3_9MAGN
MLGLAYGFATKKCFLQLGFSEGVFSRSERAFVEIISDMGIASQLEEFQQLIYASISDRNWALLYWLFDVEFFDADGVLSVTTTGISDNEISHYHLNLKEIGSARRLTRLPSSSKSGAKFRHAGTEVSMTTSVSIDDLTAEIKHFFQKVCFL